ncbi:MAG: TRCF domain-containing protein, partial [Pseudomonadota bacterium]
FGPLPEPVQQLFRVTEVKLMMQPLGIKRLDLGSDGGRVEFNHDTRVDPGVIVALVQNESATYRLEGATLLRITRDLPEFEQRLAFAFELLGRFAAESGPTASRAVNQ